MTQSARPVLIFFDGTPLKIEQITAIAQQQAQAALSPEPAFRARIQKGADFLDRLLAEDGVIFVCIGDQEVDSARKLLSEIYGSDNCVATLVWEKKNKGAFLSNDITNIKDYVLVYAKSKAAFSTSR